MGNYCDNNNYCYYYCNQRIRHVDITLYVSFCFILSLLYASACTMTTIIFSNSCSFFAKYRNVGGAGQLSLSIITTVYRLYAA